MYKTVFVGLIEKVIIIEFKWTALQISLKSALCSEWIKYSISALICNSDRYLVQPNRKKLFSLKTSLGSQGSSTTILLASRQKVGGKVIHNVKFCEIGQSSYGHIS